MSIHRLKKDLSLLKDIAPSPSWRNARRDLLMRQVQAQTVPLPKLTGSERLVHNLKSFHAGLTGLFSAVAARGLAVSVLAIFLSLGSGGYLVAAADQSLPNQKLYSLKITVEELRLKLARSPKERVALEIELATRRLDELTRLQQSGNSSEHVSLLVSRFEERLSSVTSTVANNSNDTSANRQDIARMIDERVAAYEYSLAEAKKSATTNLSLAKSVDKAKVAVSRAETQALKVIVENETDPQTDLAKKIDEKIKVAEESLKAVDTKLAGGAKTDVTKAAQDQSAVAKDNLAAAKQKVVEGDYRAAIGLLEGVEDIVNQVIEVSDSATQAEVGADGQVEGQADSAAPTADSSANIN